MIWADRRFRLGHGRVVALYVMVYTLGRGWIENLRIDTVELNDVVGLRFNVWTSIVLFVRGRGLLRGQSAGATRAARSVSTARAASRARPTTARAPRTTPGSDARRRRPAPTTGAGRDARPGTTGRIPACTGPRRGQSSPDALESRC